MSSGCFSRCTQCGHFAGRGSFLCKKCLKSAVGSKNLLAKRLLEQVPSERKLQKVVFEEVPLKEKVQVQKVVCDCTVESLRNPTVVSCDDSTTSVVLESNFPSAPFSEVDSLDSLGSTCSGSYDGCVEDGDSVEVESVSSASSVSSLDSGESLDSCNSGCGSKNGRIKGQTDMVQKGDEGYGCCPCITEYGHVVPCEKYCLNCHRCENDGFDGLHCYSVVLELHSTNELSFGRKKWRTFGKEDCCSSCVLLCKECFQLVQKEPEWKGPNWMIIWPVYVWKLLSNVELQSVHGCGMLKFIPQQWHGFWKSELLRVFPDVFNVESFNELTSSLCVDITRKRLWFEKVQKELSLGVMKTVCNSLLVPVCLCPWGCSSYYFENGRCDFDAVMHRYLSFVPSTGTACKVSAMEKLVSAREDFFGEPDMHLFNPEWKVLPSVYYQDGVGPVFLTCKEHNGGTSYRYFHLPKSHSVLPSRHSESLSLAVFRSRTLKPTVPMKYSNGYRLQKCMATYCGVDTAYICEQRHFDYLSHIEDLNEACSFSNRDDIKGLASGLVKSGALSKEYLENLKERSKLLFGSNGDATDGMCVGSTLTTLPEAIKLQRLLASSGVIHFENEDFSFIPNWPSSLIFVHEHDGYGSRFADVPMFKSMVNKKTKLAVCLSSFWLLCHCVCSIPELWEELHYSVSSRGGVQGFFLSYLARNMLKQKGSRGKKKNPFYVGVGHDMMKPEFLFRSLLPKGTAIIGLPDEVLMIIKNFWDLSKVNVVEVTRTPSQSLCDAIEAVGGCTEQCRVLIVHGKGNLMEDRVSVDGHVMELRLIAVSNGLKTVHKPNSWTNEVWRRHGILFKKWWVTQRSPVSNRTLKKDSTVECNMEKVSFAIYCRVEDVKYCDIRRQYLKYIGGQNHVFCKIHDVPLITSKVFRKKSGKRCCNIVHGSSCARHEDICCPIDGCKVCVCKECKIECPEDSVTFFEYIAEDSTSPEDDSDASVVVESVSDKESIQNMESDDESWMEDSPVSILHTGCDAPMFDMEHLPSDGNEDGLEDELALEGLIPTTLSGAMCTSFENSIGTMGTSVLLNKFGTVLVRRDNRLQASRRERNMVEKVVARESGNCIPLLYLEGMMFPSIFWSHPDSSRGGLLGSIPTALFCQHETRKRFHIASLADHAKVRLKCCGSSASTNPNYLAFLFDCLANGALEGQDTRVVLSRGFQESMGPAGMRMRNGEDDFYTDTIDNRQCCHNLCASERDKPNSLFLTLTCNQREHFGVAHVKRYVDSPVALDNYKSYLRRKFPHAKELSPKEEDEVRFAFQEAARNLIVRNWMEIRLLLIKYLLKSPEKPVGDILKMFVRDEYQKEAGNLSHLHILITLAEGYDSPEGKKKIENLIRGFIDEIVGLDEVHRFIEEGIFDNWADYEEMKDQAIRILPHSCNSHRCLRRVGPHNNELVCRVPDTRKLSTDLMSFYEKDIEVEHNGEAIKIYERLGFCENMTESDGKFCPRVDFLQAKRILAPARFGEGNITPVVGKLFAATRSSMNVQICTSFGTSRYVVKYITKIDENNYVVFSVSDGNHEVYKTELVNLHNTKITSSAINEAKKLKASRHRNKPKGRAIAATEMMQIMLGFPQVYTNVEYIKVQTLPLGDRPGLERRSPEEKYEQKVKEGHWTAGKAPDLYSFCVPEIENRIRLFSGDVQQRFRLFTDSQRILLKDQVHSPITVDRVTIFGIRPPELLFIDKMEWYFKYFHRSKCPILYSDVLTFDSIVSKNLDKSYWIDGLGYRIRIRPRAIIELSKLLDTCNFQTQMKDKGYILMFRLFRDIFSMYAIAGITVGKSVVESPLVRLSQLRWNRIQDAVIAIELENVILPIPVFSNVRPKNATKFIIHVLLSMGHFETEADLWKMSSLRDAFVYARLLTVNDVAEINQATCDDLLKAWMQDQLQYYPISSRTLDDYVCSANSIFQAILLRDEVPIDELPPCLYTDLVDDVSQSTLEYKRKVKCDLITATLNGLSSACGDAIKLPTHDSLMQASKSFTVPEVRFQGSDVQSSQSFVEQENAVGVAKNAIVQYCTPTNVSTRGVIITGPPGAGKTHCLLQSILFALCKGLLGITTAILAERAFLLGGQHFHKLFHIPVRDHGFRVHRMAELAVVSLQKRPESVSLLRSLDILFVDEMGQVSAELLSVLDIIMRRIRDSSLFMGGVLVIATLDQVQLRPIKELPFLLSPYVLTCFRMVKLKHYVRCSDCAVLQEMNEIARFFSNVPEEIESKLARFRCLVSTCCTFLPTWDDLEGMDDVLRIFPKRKHAMEATRAFLASKKKSVCLAGRQYLSRKACDTMVPLESHGDWTPASAVVVKQLNRKATEPEQLDFFEGAVYQFTFNSPKKFNATQLCVLLEVPSMEDLESFAPIKVMAAPPGTKIFNMEGKKKEDLIGWKEVHVGPAPEYVQPMWYQGVKAKRKQYGLKHHVASTVHSAIGHTLYKVATELSTVHGLWERAMVVVLISRVKFAKDIIFVGNKEENIEALIKGLKIRCQYDDYMNHIVDVLCGDANATQSRTTIDLREHPYRPRDIQLPVDTTGVVYLLASTKRRSTFYVGFTQNIRVRLRQHNSGYGSQSTTDTALRPWALVAYVTGFSGDRTLMQQFEKSWQQKNLYFTPASVEGCITLAEQLAADEYSPYSLVVVKSI